MQPLRRFKHVKRMEKMNRGCLGTKQKYDNNCNGKRK